MSLEKQRIVCFVCNWTSSDENLVKSKARKIADVNVVRVACIGGLDPFLIFEILAKGIDGVLLVGCSPPDCHFVNGSSYAEFTIKVLKKLLVLTGLEQERLELRFVSPIEKVEFTSIIENFVTLLQTLGHSPLAGEKPDLNIFENVLAAKNALTDFRLRAFIAKQLELTRNVNVYRERFPPEEFDALLDEVLRAEFIRQKILLLAKKKPVSVKELAQVLNMKPATVLRHILNMRRKGMIVLDSTDGTTPLYKALEAQ
jgi:coenzyme F420-reducing hydrogenase delta subunit